MPIRILLNKAKSTDDPKIKEFLADLYPRFYTWQKWYIKFLQNLSMPCTFSWRHRKSTDNEQSLLDDYPRGHVVNDAYEIHLDLQTWMIEFSDTLLDWAKL